MTATYTVDGDALLTVRRNSGSFQEVADYGRVGSGSMILNDAPGTLTIVGHKEFIAEESACSFERTLTGYIGERTIRRNTERTGGGRELETTILDLNARLAFYVIRGKAWKRPEETIDDRLHALLASAFLSPLVADNGFVEYPSHMLDANDYRGQFPADVLRDMAMEVGFNFFVYWDDPDGPSLWFKDSNVSTAFSSSLRLSNDLDDIDESTTFPVSLEVTSLRRDPSQVYSGVFMPYQKGYVFRARAATSLAYEPRHGVAPNSQVKKRAKAIALTDKFLFERRNEEDVITTKVQLPADKVNLIRAGQRLEARFTDFGPEGYDSFNWFRVVDRTVHPLLKVAALYDIDLTLSPQEGGCSVTPTLVQSNYQDATDVVGGKRFDFTSPTGAGNLLILGTISGDPITSLPAGWNRPITNMNIDVGGTSFLLNVAYRKGVGESSVTAVGGGVVDYGAVVEYAGLTNPVLSGSPVTLRQTNLGYADVPDISYPDGPSLVFSVGGFQHGPGSGDHLTCSGTGHSLVYDIDSASGGDHEFLINPALGMGQSLLGVATTAGSVTDWQYQFTDLGFTLTAGLVFVGDNCE